MVAMKPEHVVGNGILVNTGNVDLDWEIRTVSNVDNVNFAFQNTSGTATKFDLTDGESGFSTIHFMVTSNDSFSQAGKAYEILTELIVTKKGADLDAEPDAQEEIPIEVEVYVTAEASGPHSSPHYTFPVSLVAGMDLEVGLRPTDQASMAISHSLSTQSVLLLVTQPGVPPKECTLIFRHGEEYTYRTSSCSLESMKGGEATFSLKYIGAFGTSYVFQHLTLTVECPDELMSPTGPNGLCQCPAGYFAGDVVGANDGETCIACDKDTYNENVGSVNENDCTACPSFTQTNTTNSTSIGMCTCKGAFVMTNSDSRNCDCPAGSYLSGNEIDGECIACESGKIMTTSNRDSDCISCESDLAKGDRNTGTNGKVGSTSIVDCVCTDVAMLVDGADGMCKCPAGYSYDQSEKSCVLCPLASFADEASLKGNCYSCQDPNSNTTNVGSTNSSACVCRSSLMEKDAFGTCGCQRGYHFEDDDGDGIGDCVLCPVDTHEDIVGLHLYCETCASTDINTHTNGVIGSETIDDCVCVDPNMAVDPQNGMCGCKPGYYYIASETGNDAGSCERCPLGFFSERIGLPSSCNSCAEEVDANTNTTNTGSMSSNDCVCHAHNQNMQEEQSIGFMCGCVAGYYFVDTDGDGTGTCELCPIDTYSDTVSLEQSCDACADANSYTNSTEGSYHADHCVCRDPIMLRFGSSNTCGCPPGYLFVESDGDDGISRCEKCPTGEFKTEIDLQKVCLKCTAEYGNNYTGIYLSTTLESGSTSPIDCGCAEGSYLSELSELCDVSAPCCVPCPEGSICDGFGTTVRSLQLEEGYWRAREYSNLIVLCSEKTGHEDSCRGGSNTTNFGAGTCLDGHTGPYCDVCGTGWALDKDSGECFECNDEVHDVAVAVVVVVFILFFGLFFYTAYKGAKAMQRAIDEINSIDELENSGENGSIDGQKSAMAEQKILEAKAEIKKKVDELKAKKDAVMARVNKLRAFYKSARTPLKIFISFSQIVSGLPDTIELKFPEEFTSLAHKLNFVNFDIGALFAQSCVMESSFISELYVITGGPILFLVFLLAMIKFCKMKNDPIYDIISEEIFKLILLGSYLMMPAATVKTFTTFRCDGDLQDPSLEPEPLMSDYGEFLKADYSIRCDGNDAYDRATLWALAMIFVYPIGIPFSYIFFLHKHKHTIDPGQEELVMILKSEEKALEMSIQIRDNGPYAKEHSKYSFLYEAYEPKCWWFEIFDTYRRLTLTAGLILLRPGTVLQIVFSMIICLISMRVYAGSDPYIKDRDDTLAEIMQWQIFFTMLAALLLKVDITGEGVSEDDFGQMLVYINMVGPAMLFCHSVFYGDKKSEAKERFEKLKAKAERVPCCGRAIGAKIAVTEAKLEEKEKQMLGFLAGGVTAGDEFSTINVLKRFLEENPEEAKGELKDLFGASDDTEPLATAKPQSTKSESGEGTGQTDDKKDDAPDLSTKVMPFAYDGERRN